jgi:cell volume regulation protein A
MAVLLTIGMIQLITGEVSGPLEILPTFVLQMAIGAGLGIVFGRIALMIINRINLEYDGLYTVLSLALMLLTYGGTTLATGNGFLAVYIAGLVIARSDFIHRRSLIGFHDGLAWLMQIIMFLTLGLLVFPSNVIAVAPQGLLIALFLMVVARPISVFVALIPSKLTFRERVLLSWVGMRGAAPIILATFPLVAGLPSASIIFNVVFFVVLASVILQGTTISLAGRWLGLVDDSPDTSNRLLPELIDQGKIEDQLAEIVVSATSDVIGKQIIDLRLPPEVLMMLIQRQGEIVIPRGGTRLEANDRVLVLAPAEMRDDVLRLLTT